MDGRVSSSPSSFSSLEDEACFCLPAPSLSSDLGGSMVPLVLCQTSHLVVLLGRHGKPWSWGDLADLNIKPLIVRLSYLASAGQAEGRLLLFPGPQSSLPVPSSTQQRSPPSSSHFLQMDLGRVLSGRNRILSGCWCWWTQ